MGYQVRSALSVVALAMAKVLAPEALIAPSAWAAQNLTVPDGPRAGERWDPALTPYIIEPLDHFGPESGVNEQAVMKSAQTGFTTLAIAAAGHSIDRDPCRIMVIQPTDSALSDFNREKLQVAIDNSPALRRKVKPQVSRAGQGSTTYSKLFAKGSMTLTIASSAADLRSKSIKKLIRDEIDEYPDDLDGQGSPLQLSDGRLMAFLETGDWRKLDISTPTIKGASKIEQRFEAGDQRRWHVTCPGCADEFVFEFGSQFRFGDTWPHGAHYVAPCCGSVIQAHEKNRLVRNGRWIATAPAPGRFPSYHFDTLSSPFVPWSEVAKAAVSAGNDPLRLKAFWNLWLGRPYDMKGDAPDEEMLLARREPYARGVVPAAGLVLTAAADVQMNGIWYEVLARARDRQTWVVDVGFLPGDTASPEGEPFRQLCDQVLDKAFPDAWGRPRTIDALGIDSGYRSHVVYSWVRTHQRPNPETGADLILALKGEDGWSRPAIGLPRKVDIDLAGRRIVRGGCQLWQVGTWPLKGAFYADLRRQGRSTGQEVDPEGFCHFGTWLDANYFAQITAEFLAEEKFRGGIRRVWKQRAAKRDNHLLDARVYNLALAEYLGLQKMTADDWAVLEARHGAPEAERLPLMAAAADPTPQAPGTLPSATPGPRSLDDRPSPPPPATTKQPTPTWLTRQGSNWLRKG
jgi:phage terminase large subunit GpA-like protein